MTETLAEAWTRCRPWIAGAVRRFGEGSVEDAEREIAAGRAWFVPGQKAAAVVQFTTDANFWLAGGDLGEILERMPGVEAWARDLGCDRMTLIGRKGWERVLAPVGYRPIHMLAKDLT